MRKSKLHGKDFHFHPALFSTLLLVIVSSCHFSSAADTKKTKTEAGPLQPYGGRRETTFNKDTSVVEVKEYDAKGNLRRQRNVKTDKKHRLIFGYEQVFDEKHNIVRGYKLTKSYKDEVDLAGKTTYLRYDPQTKTFLLVKHLVQDYEQRMITKPPASLGLDAFYQKYVDANGIPIVSSAKTPNAALLVARDIVNYLLMKRMDIRQELVQRKSRVLVMAESEMETDLPERRDWRKPEKNDPRLTPFERENYDKPWGIGHMTDKGYWNQRARGMGGNEVSCAEENLLGYAGTRYYGENILVHEFSHNIMSALESTDPLSSQRFKKLIRRPWRRDFIRINMQ